MVLFFAFMVFAKLMCPLIRRKKILPLIFFLASVFTLQTPVLNSFFSNTVEQEKMYCFPIQILSSTLLFTAKPNCVITWWSIFIMALKVKYLKNALHVNNYLQIRKHLLNSLMLQYFNFLFWVFKDFELPNFIEISPFE